MLQTMFKTSCIILFTSISAVLWSIAILLLFVV